MSGGAKHSAGPWMAAASPSSIVGWPVVGPMGRSICSVSWMPKKAYPDVSESEYAAFNAECEANSRLVAAAPDLLDALKTILTAWRSGEDGDNVLARMGRAMEAAIAKAEGRAP